MKCPKCGSKTSIINKLTSSNNEVYIKNGCSNCGHIFFTAEFDIEETPEFKKEWNELQKAEVKDDITRVTKNYGYRCEVFRKQFVYVVYNINEAVLPNGKVDTSKSRGYFGNSVLAERECRYLEKTLIVGG